MSIDPHLTMRSITLLLVAAAASSLSGCTVDQGAGTTREYRGCEDTAAGCPQRCEADEECGVGQLCERTSGQCVLVTDDDDDTPTCETDGDCSDAERCEANTCVPRQEPPLTDVDEDGVLDDEDNCPADANPDQNDLDADGVGDLCDGDLDGDQVINGLDNCPRTPNPMQEDPDGDGLGVACDGGDLQNPLPLARGVARQRLDTRPRPDALSADCGGDGAPEVVYRALLNAGESLTLSVRADHGLALYVLGPDEDTLACSVEGSLNAVATASGPHLVVVDGLTADDAGLITVDAAVGLQSAEDERALDTEGRPGAVWTGLLNDDVLPDLVTLLPASNALLVQLGVGDGDFADATQIEIGDTPVAVWGGDVDRDGDPDLMIALEGDDAVALVLNDSLNDTLELAEAVLYDVGAGPIAVWGGDVDRDGDLDLAVANQGDDTVSVLLGDGDGGFAQSVSFEAGPGPVAVWGGDVDRDGDLDLALANFDGGVGNTLSVLSGDGLGAFNDRLALSTGDGPVAVWGGDVDNDGLPELAVAQQGGTLNGELVLYGNLGDGAFEVRDSQSVGANPVAVWGGDVDRDGDLDLVTANNVGRSLSVVRVTPDGALDTAEQLPTSQAPTYVWGDDLNGDSLPDLLAPGDDQINLLQSDADLFGAPMALPQDGVEGVWGGDVDRDGDIDLAFVNRSDNTLTLQRGLGGGLFAEPQTFQVGPNPVSVWGGDVDRDGDIDLIVANNGSPQDTTGSVSLLTGLPQGTLAEAVTLTTDNGPVNIWADEDFNGDGFLDIAVATQNGDSVSLLLTTGPGQYDDGHISIPVGAGPTSVWGGDVDRDGDSDLAVANADDNTISVLLGDNLGGFSDGGTLPVDASMPMSLWGDDLNGDGLIDFATRNAGDGTLSVILGDRRLGDGNFIAARTFQVGDGPGAVWGGDITNDGLADLAVSSDQGVVVLTGYRDGAFAAQRTLTRDLGAAWVWGADFDGDGRTDLATSQAQGVQIQFSRLGSPLEAPGARLLNSPLTPCAPTNIRGQISFQGDGDIRFPTDGLTDNCRIERLEVSIDTVAPIRAGTVLTMQGDHLASDSRRATILPSTSRLPINGRLTPELIPGLARFEGSPAKGLWRIRASSTGCPRGDDDCLPRFREVTVHVNPPPFDPLDPGQGASVCSSVVDQPQGARQLCQWDGLALDGVIDRSDDLDPLLLALNGQATMQAGQTLTLTLRFDPDATTPPSLGLHPTGARLPLARPELTEPGLLTLRFTIPEAYDGRYFSAQVTAPSLGAEPIRYTLEATLD